MVFFLNIVLLTLWFMIYSSHRHTIYFHINSVNLPDLLDIAVSSEKSLEEELNYLHEYKLLSPTKNTVPKLYYVKNNNSYLCRVIGYESNYETWSNTVIDFGEGPHFIHSDYLREMQNRERKKGESLDKLPDTYVIFNLETTSKYARTCEVIQIGAIRIADNQITETFSSYVKPLHPIPASATKINGITDLTVCMAPDIKTILPEF